MLDLNLTVVYQDGTKQGIQATPGNIVRAERHFGKPLTELFHPERLSLESMAYLAWESIRHKAARGMAGYTDPGPFDTWLDTLDDIEMEDDLDTAPLPETPSAGD
jgi:hypothetical protein